MDCSDATAKNRCTWRTHAGSLNLTKDMLSHSEIGPLQEISHQWKYMTKAKSTITTRRLFRVTRKALVNRVAGCEETERNTFGSVICLLKSPKACNQNLHRLNNPEMRNSIVETGDILLFQCKIDMKLEGMHHFPGCTQNAGNRGEKVILCESVKTVRAIAFSAILNRLPKGVIQVRVCETTGLAFIQPMLCFGRM